MSQQRHMAEKWNFGTEKRELKLGASFTNPKSTAFHTIRYDFKPASVDVNKAATIDVGANNQVTVNVPHLDGAGTTRTVFKGSQKPYQKECILIIDPVTGEMTLERLSCNIQVKKTRAETQKPVLEKETALPKAPPIKVPKKPNTKNTTTKVKNIPPVKVVPSLPVLPVEEPPKPKIETQETQEVLSGSSSSSSSSSSDDDDDDSDEEEEEEEDSKETSDNVPDATRKVHEDKGVKHQLNALSISGDVLDDLDLSDSDSDSD